MQMMLQIGVKVSIFHEEWCLLCYLAFIFFFLEGKLSQKWQERKVYV